MQNTIRPAALLRAPIPTLLAGVLVAGYGIVRAAAGVPEPFGIGLAALPLFVAAIFLGRWTAALVALAITVITVGPMLGTNPWTRLDSSLVAELAVLVVSATFLRLGFGRIAARDASRAAREARLNDRIESVLGIAQRLTTSLDRTEVFQLIVSEMNRAVATDATTIRIRRGDALELVAWAGLADDLAGQLPPLSTSEDWFQEIEGTRRPWYRDDVDAVAICTPSGSHAEIALAALRHGKHVVVEKPLALSMADADAVIAEGRRADRLVATISQRRFEPIMEAVRAAVADNAFGRIALIIGEGLYHRPQSYYDSAAWRGTRAMDGGVLMNQAIHMVDLVRWIGGPVASVAARVATIGHAMEAEDTATVSLRFANGALGSIVATTCAEPGFDQELRVYGDLGHARIVGQQALEWSLAPGTDVSIPAGQSGPGAAATPEAQLAPATWGTDATGHIRQYADIVAAIRTGRAPAVTGEDGRNAVEIVVAAVEASDTGRTVTLRTPAG